MLGRTSCGGNGAGWATSPPTPGWRSTAPGRSSGTRRSRRGTGRRAVLGRRPPRTPGTGHRHLAAGPDRGSGPRADRTPSSLRLQHAINAGDDPAAAMLRSGAPTRPSRLAHADQIGRTAPARSIAGRGSMSAASIRTRSSRRSTHCSTAFIEDRSHHRHPRGWDEEETKTPIPDPALWLLARDGVARVGVVTASTAGDRGWVDYLAVAASHRGRRDGRGPLSSIVRSACSRSATSGACW